MVYPDGNVNSFVFNNVIVYSFTFNDVIVYSFTFNDVIVYSFTFNDVLLSPLFALIYIIFTKAANKAMNQDWVTRPAIIGLEILA